MDIGFIVITLLFLLPVGVTGCCYLRLLWRERGNNGSVDEPVENTGCSHACCQRARWCAHMVTCPKCLYLVKLLCNGPSIIVVPSEEPSTSQEETEAVFNVPDRPCTSFSYPYGDEYIPCTAHFTPFSAGKNAAITADQGKPSMSVEVADETAAGTSVPFADPLSVADNFPEQAEGTAIGEIIERLI